MNAVLILTCEHAGNRVPAAYKALFRDAAAVLDSHRGWDPGALALAKRFQRRLAAPLFYSMVTRLLVEPNRSIGHRGLFSEFTAGFDAWTKRAIVGQYYYPHRRRVESWIGHQMGKGLRVVHLSLHTFTPQLNGRVRNADVGLLYDPRRGAERVLCDRWRAALKQRRPDLRIRRNYPYRGRSDGLTTYLRRRFPAAYMGVELEVNQIWPAEKRAHWRPLQQALVDSFAAVWQP